jgi:hypothetical protein
LNRLIRRRRRRAGTAPVLSPRCGDDKLDLLLGGRGGVFSSLRRRRRWRGGGVGRGGGRGGGAVLVAGALGAVDVVRVQRLVLALLLLRECLPMSALLGCERLPLL